MDEALNRAFKALLEMDLREKMQSAILNPDLPPPTPQEQAIYYIENAMHFRVDEDGYMWSDEHIVGEFEGVELIKDNLIIKTKMYYAIALPFSKRKTHGS